MLAGLLELAGFDASGKGEHLDAHVAVLQGVDIDELVLNGHEVRDGLGLVVGVLEHSVLLPDAVDVKEWDHRRVSTVNACFMDLPDLLRIDQVYVQRVLELLLTQALAGLLILMEGLKLKQILHIRVGSLEEAGV